MAYWFSIEVWNCLALWAKILGWSMTIVGVLIAIGGHVASSNATFLEKQRAAPRSLNEAQQSAILHRQSLKGREIPVVRYGDKEAGPYADSIKQSLEKAGA